uniref:Ribosome maturation protein SDO1/SBDS N-terminal domain-containing protein n=1 Tax=Lotharella oceanica TaxID=641309 RepID=A0A7S2TL83_9EUKA|mmetsp:Transcript_19417/g.36572  ORF Transcript_19417/g.36572 Transcript_19417/m.36572 type:complete len:246 (+) Transcript_19417:131-868(+)
MPSHHDTDYVSYKSKTTGKKFEVFTKPQKAMEWRNTRKAKAAAEGSGGQREGGADTAAVLAQACVYRDVKKLKVASAGELMAEFGTEDALEAAAFILEKGKLRVKVYIRRPVMELTLDAVFAMETVTALYTCYHKEGVLPKFLAACIMVAIVVTLTMTLCRTCGRWLSTRMLPQPPFNDPLSEDTVLRQFQTQMWQLIAHVTMSAFGLYAYLDGDDFLEHPARLMQPWQVTKPIRVPSSRLFQNK